MTTVFRAPSTGGSILDRTAETYVVTGTLRHAGLTGFQLNAGTSGLTIESLEGPDNAADFNNFSLGANEELIFGQPITQIKLSAGDGAVYNSAERPATWYVSSHSGDDNNTGFTSSLQLRTISKLMEFQIAAGDEIILEDDSLWRERLNVGNGVTISRSNTGTAKPILDGGNIATGWTLTGGQANTYELAWVPEVGDGLGDFLITVFEDGALLTYQTSIANCEANPGSYYVDGKANTSGNTIYVHPTGSTNPNSNGSQYIAAIRGTCIGGGDNVSIDGVVCTRNVNPNGSVVLGENASVANCEILYGGKHNIYMRSGQLTNSEIKYNEATQLIGSGTETLVVFNAPDPTTFTGVMTGCTLEGGRPGVSDIPEGTVGIYAHGAGGAVDDYLSITVSNCTFTKLDSPGSPKALTYTFTGNTIQDCIGVGVSATSNSQNTIENNFFSASSISTSEYMRIDAGKTVNYHGNKFYGNRSNVRPLYFPGDGTINASKNSFFGIEGSLSAVLAVANGATVNVTFINNAMFGFQNTLNFGSNSPTVVSNNNVSLRNDTQLNPVYVYGGTTYFSLGQWQAAPPAQDANSQLVNPGFVDPANGDFTTTAPEVDTLQAGVEYYVAS